MAQTLKFGNKTWATKVGSTLAYNDENDNYKPLPFAFTRSTSATRVNKQGLIEVVTNDIPRIDYTDGCGSILLEPQSTNTVTYSENFDQYLLSLITTPIQSGFLAPDGTNTAYKITGVIGSSSIYLPGGVTSTTATRSIWARTDRKSVV